ncbi:RNA helicase [Corynebacterium sp. Q4381]|uniref:RNA helicase n=1 Tax=Corynebacterium sp. Marseille-Q4381 TaxID=3121597 RepID=UPI002FE539D1
MPTPTHSSRATQRSTGHRPSRGQIAAAKLMVKREQEGKGRVEITPKIRELAAFELS